MCVRQQSQPALGDQRGHARVAAEGGDVVDVGRPGVERGRGDRGLRGVDRDLRPSRGQGLDHRDDAAQLLGLGDRLGAGPRRLAADVEDVRARRPRAPARASTAAAASRHAPPSENESGVTLTTPMISNGARHAAPPPRTRRADVVEAAQQRARRGSDEPAARRAVGVATKAQAAAARGLRGELTVTPPWTRRHGRARRRRHSTSVVDARGPPGGELLLRARRRGITSQRSSSITRDSGSPWASTDAQLAAHPSSPSPTSVRSRDDLAARVRSRAASGAARLGRPAQRGRTGRERLGGQPRGHGLGLLAPGASASPRPSAARSARPARCAPRRLATRITARSRRAASVKSRWGSACGHRRTLPRLGELWLLGEVEPARSARGPAAAAGAAVAIALGRAPAAAAGTSAAAGASAPKTSSSDGPSSSATNCVLLDRLALDEDLGDRLELLAVLGEDVLRPLVRGLDDAADLVVDLARDLVGVVGLGGELAAEERLAVVVAEHARAELARSCRSA